MKTLKSLLAGILLSVFCLGTAHAANLYDPNICIWQQPVLLEYLNKPDVNANAYSPFLSRDRLTLLYCIRPNTDYVRRIVIAQRESLDAPFYDVRTLDELNSGRHNYNPCLSPDGNRLYYSRYEGGTTRIRMRQAMYNEQTGLWEPQLAFSNIHIIGKNDVLGSISDDELTVYYRSERDGKDKLWMATRNSVNEQFKNPKPISELNINDIQISPHVLPSGRTIYFAARPLNGLFNIYRASRPDITFPFSNIEKVCISNPDLNDYYPYVTPEEDVLLYSNELGVMISQADELQQAFALIEQAEQTKLDIAEILTEAVSKEKQAVALLSDIHDQWDLDPHQRNEIFDMIRHLTLAILREEQSQRSLQDSIEQLQQIFETK